MNGEKSGMQRIEGNLNAPACEQVQARDNVLEFKATLRRLKSKVDPDLVKQREGWRDRDGKVRMVDYIEWHTVADILDDIAPSWGHSVKHIERIGSIAIVTVAITIDGVTREGVGTGAADSEAGIKKAEHDALKRAAVKFGIARELYKNESDATEVSVSSDAGMDVAFPFEPIAGSLGELVTSRQLAMIRAISRDLNVDADDECAAVMTCRTAELTREAASALITHLQVLQRSRNSSTTPPLKKAS